MDVIVVLLSAFSLAAWIYLIGFRGSFWRADLRLEPSLPPPPPSKVQRGPSVGIRNLRSAQACTALSADTVWTPDRDGVIRWLNTLYSC